jgi:hypothetical protein
MAARDAGTAPEGPTSAADTAALLEFARVLSGRATGKTVVLASVDGSTVGEAGARRFAEASADRELIDAVLVVSNLGARNARGPLIVEWSNDASRASIGWQRTVAASLREELGGLPGQEGALGQLVRLAVPLGVGAQGPLLAEGLPALRLSGSGEVAPPPAAPPGDRAGEQIDPGRFGDLGRAALRAISALDSGAVPEPGPRTYLTVARQVLPGWVLSALALALLLPAVVVSVDAFARARRRRDPVARWVPWLAVRTLPFLIGLAVAYALALAGAVPTASEAAPRPELARPGGAAWAVLIAVAGAAAITAAVAFVRRRRAPRPAEAPGAAAPGAACVCALATAGLGLAVWWSNPFAALLLVPTVHAWILAALRRRPPRPGEERRGLSARTRAVLVLVGLAVPIAVSVYYIDRLTLGPLEVPWYALRVVAGSHTSLGAALLGCLFLGLLAAVSTVVAAIHREPPPVKAEPKPAVAPLGRSLLSPVRHDLRR